MTRLPPQSAELIDRNRKLTFTFDGKKVHALEGDTIGSALYAAGQRTFSRSFKYHRRRGLMCCSGNCPNCLVAVDGAPGVRACTEPARDGAKVEHLNARPSLEHDVMSITDSLGGPFTPPGFYYKTFIRPRRLWPFYEKVLRNAAGLGSLPESQRERTWRTEYRRRHADVLVVGGGAAGLAAAAAAAELGADVVLVDDGTEPGGRLLWEGGHEQARTLHRARAHGGRRDPHQRAGTWSLRRPRAGVAGRHASPDSRAPSHLRDRRDRAATRVLGQRSPGRDALERRAPARDALRVSRRAGARSIVTTGDRGIRAALALQAAGVDVAAVADLRRAPSRARAVSLPTESRRYRAGRSSPRAAAARSAVRHSPRSPTSTPARTRSSFASSNATCSSSPAATPRRPPCRRRRAPRPSTTRRRGHFRLDRLPAGVWAAGQLAGEGHWNIARESGELAGLEAARALGLAMAAEGTRRDELRAPGQRGARRGRRPAGGRRRGLAGARVRVLLRGRQRQGHPARRQGGLRLDRAVQAVHDRDDGAMPGPDVPAAVGGLIAQETGRQLADVGTTTARPPWSTVPTRRARRASDRAGQALVDPRAPPRARREDHVGRRLAPSVRLRRSRG